MEQSLVGEWVHQIDGFEVLQGTAKVVAVGLDPSGNWSIMIMPRDRKLYALKLRNVLLCGLTYRTYGGGAYSSDVVPCDVEGCDRTETVKDKESKYEALESVERSNRIGPSLVQKNILLP